MAEQVEGTGRTRAGRAAPAGPERWSHKTRDQEKLTWPGAPSTRTEAAAPAGAGVRRGSSKPFPAGRVCSSRYQPGAMGLGQGLPKLSASRGISRGLQGQAGGSPRDGHSGPGAAHAALFVLALFTHTNLKHLPRFLRKLLHSDEVAAAVIKTQLITYLLNCDDRILSIW